MISSKLVTQGLLIIRIFWNKSYDVIIGTRDVSNKILSRDADYIADVVMRQKFDNSIISMSYYKLKFIKIRSKNNFCEGWSRFNFDNLELWIDMALKFYTTVRKGLKLKVRKFFGLIPTIVGNTVEKMAGDGFLLAPSWIWLRLFLKLKFLY